MKETGTDKLKEWLLEMRLRGYRYLRTSDIFKWGTKNYSTRAARNARDLAAHGQYLSRVSEDEKRCLGVSIKEGLYKLI